MKRYQFIIGLLILMIIAASLYTKTEKESAKILELKIRLEKARDLEKAELYNLLAKEYITKSSLQQGYKYAIKAEKYAKQFQQDDQLIFYKVNVADYYRRHKKLKTALNHSKSALTLANRLNNSDLKLKALNMIITICFMEKKIDYLSGLNYLKQSLDIYKEKKDLQKITTYTHYMGSINSLIHDYKNSLTYYIEALKLYTAQKNKKKMAQMYSYIGKYYSNNGYQQKALASFNTAMKLIQNEDFKDYTCRIYQNFGWYYIRLKQYEKALLYVEAGLPFALKHNLDLHQTLFYIKLSDIYMKKGQYGLSLKNLKLATEANKKDRSISKKGNQVNIQLKRAKRHLLMNNLKNTESILSELDTTFNEYDYWNYRLAYCKLYARLHLRQEKKEKAFYSYQEALAVAQKIKLYVEQKALLTELATLSKSLMNTDLFNRYSTQLINLKKEDVVTEILNRNKKKLKVKFD